MKTPWFLSVKRAYVSRLFDAVLVVVYVQLQEAIYYICHFLQSGDILSMPVPSSYNDITEERWLRDFVGWVWYEKQFYAPPSWRATSRRVVLRFDSVFYRCKVVSLSIKYHPFRVIKKYNTPSRNSILLAYF